MFNTVFEISFVVTLFSLIFLRPLAIKLKLVDIPTDRKNHRGQVPSIGGICIFIGLLSSQIYENQFDKVSLTILLTAGLILILGIWDDFLNLTAKIKLNVQILVVIITIYFADLKLESFGSLFGMSYPLDLGMFSVPITIIAVIGLTNAFNMIDGIDGLAGGLVLTAFFGMFFYNILSADFLFTNILLAIVAGIIPFLALNISTHSKFKVFLGDGGSLFLGYIVSWALIYSAENNNNFSPTFALWCVTIPLFDFMGVVIIRLLEKRSVISADRHHIHHFLESLGLPRKISMVIIISLSLFTLLLGFVLEKYFPSISFSIFIILFLLYLFSRLLLKFKVQS